MSYLAKNNAYSTLAAGLSVGAVSMQVAAGKGDLFPVIAGADYTLVTLEDAAANREIIKITLRNAASDVMTIEREQEGTTARSWNIGDVVELRMTAALVQTAMGHPANTSGAHAASAIANTPAGGIAATDVQTALNELDSDKEPKDASILKSAAIGVSVQGYDVNTAKLNVAQSRTAVETLNPTAASSASYTWAVNTDPNLVLTTTGNLTMNAPTGLTIGSFYFLEIVYGGTHTVTWNAAFKGITGLTLTSTAAARDAFMFRAQTASILELVGTRFNVGA